MEKEIKCDKYDYLIAVGCGAVASVIDVFFVDMPGESKLGNLSDQQAEKLVVGVAKKMGWKPQSENADSNHAIAFLERQEKFKVNYDQSVSSAAGEVFDITPSNHHMKSLAHSPDVIGLFFSILNQFTSTSTFVSGGQIITKDTEKLELKDGILVKKLYDGFVKWLGHLLSDFAGSQHSKGRGSGIVLPFYELFGFFDKTKITKDGKTLAQIATKAFEQGYDARFGIAMAIPVVLMDVSIRLMWSIRRYYQYGWEIKDCIPTNRHSDLRLMLIVGNGTLCAIDGADALIRSGGNAVTFFMRLNLAAWFKLVMMIIKEVCIRLADGKFGELKASKQRMEEMQKLLLQIQEQEKKYRNEFTLEFSSIFEGNEIAIEKAFGEMANAVTESDINNYIMQLNNIGKAFGIDYQFESYEQIDSNMSDPGYVFDF